MRVGILTLRNRYTRGSTIFYPLIKWRKEFLEEHVKFTFYKHHEDEELLGEDAVIIDSRYCRQLTVLDKQYENLNFIKEFINKLKQKNVKVLLFDNSDSAGGRYFELIEFVDLHVKKQVLKDIYAYTQNEGGYSYRVFTEGYDLSEERKKANQNIEHVPCPATQLNKIKLGWNIGLEDYRYFPLKRFYPIGTAGLLNDLYKVPKFHNDFHQRTYASSFRGTINRENENYSFQRNKVIELFNHLDSDEYITGGKISKKKYLRELRNCKVCVSPFGWGEVCFRDFEGVLSGCILLKPDMSHIETYPDIYIKDETYVPLEWDMSDLKEKLQMIIEDFEGHIAMIKKAQAIYKDAILNFPEFRKRFMSLIS